MDIELFCTLVLETIGSCNRTCASCHRQTLRSADGSLPLLRTVETKTGNGKKMSRELFDRLVDEAADLGFKGTLWLQYYSEPLLDDRLVDLAKFAKERLPQANISITTNADLMTPKIAARLNGVMDRIGISLYLPSKRQAARKKELRRWLPRPWLTFTPGTHFLLRGAEHPAMKNDIASVIDTPCTRPNSYLAVAHNGMVCHCCLDANAEFGLGNVHDSTIRELWFGDTYRKLVATLSRPGGRRAYEPCQGCPRPDSGTVPRPRFPVVPP